MPDGDEKKPGIASTMVHRAPWWVPWSFLLLLFLGWAGYQFAYVGAVAETNAEARQVIRESTIRSCERVNLLRDEVNSHGELLKNVLDVGAMNTSEQDPAFARELERLSDEIDRVEITDCEEEFPREIEQIRLDMAGH